MVTHAKVGIFKPKVCLSTFVVDCIDIEPTRVVDALSTPAWKSAIDLEYQAPNGFSESREIRMTQSNGTRLWSLQRDFTRVLGLISLKRLALL